MKIRKMFAAAAFGFSALATMPASAGIVMYGDESLWKVDVDVYTGTATTLDAAGSSPSSITLTGGSVLSAFSTPLTTYLIGSGWATWPGQPGSNGTTVYYSGGAASVTMDFAAGSLLYFGSIRPVDSFGFYVEPNSFSSFDITLGLESGESITQSVVGDAGAKFFGWTGDDVTTLTISCADGCGGFAFGDFYEGAIPEPISLALLGLGLAGIGLARRRRTI